MDTKLPVNDSLRPLRSDAPSTDARNESTSDGIWPRFEMAADWYGRGLVWPQIGMAADWFDPRLILAAVEMAANR